MNEFGLQSSHGLEGRLLLRKLPSTQLSVLLLHIYILVNERIYKNRLVNDESTRNRTHNRGWDEFLKSWLPVSSSSDFTNPSLLFVNVTDGIDVCGQLSRSWSNIANANVVASLLFSWYKYAFCPIVQETKAYGCHLVPYEDQRIL